MTIAYNKYYQTKNLFGEPYPELIDFYVNYPKKGKLLDLGCGQGRNAIPLARLGYIVTGIDHSKVGIEQMNKSAKAENLKLTAIEADIYNYDHFAEFDFILLDSMFHFTKKEKKKETNLIKRILIESGQEAIITFCIQNIGNKVRILNETIDLTGRHEKILEIDLEYQYRDDETGHSSKVDYKMMAIKK